MFVRYMYVSKSKLKSGSFDNTERMNKGFKRD